MERIKISIKGIKREVKLNTSEMASSVWKILPVKGKANRWGDEIYFSISVKIVPGETKKVVEKGDIAFCPPDAFCIFFGPTPASTETEIRPASEVILLGKVEGDLEAFKTVKDGDQVLIERVE